MTSFACTAPVRAQKISITGPGDGATSSPSVNVIMNGSLSRVESGNSSSSRSSLNRFRSKKIEKRQSTSFLDSVISRPKSSSVYCSTLPKTKLPNSYSVTRHFEGSNSNSAASNPNPVKKSNGEFSNNSSSNGFANASNTTSTDFANPSNGFSRSTNTGFINNNATNGFTNTSSGFANRNSTEKLTIINSSNGNNASGTMTTNMNGSTIITNSNTGGIAPGTTITSSVGGYTTIVNCGDVLGDVNNGDQDVIMGSSIDYFDEYDELEGFSPLTIHHDKEEDYSKKCQRRVSNYQRKKRQEESQIMDPWQFVAQELFRQEVPRRDNMNVGSSTSQKQKKSDETSTRVDSESQAVSSSPSSNSASGSVAESVPSIVKRLQIGIPRPPIAPTSSNKREARAGYGNGNPNNQEPTSSAPSSGLEMDSSGAPSLQQRGRNSPQSPPPRNTSAHLDVSKQISPILYETENKAVDETLLMTNKLITNPYTRTEIKKNEMQQVRMNEIKSENGTQKGASGFGQNGFAGGSSSFKCPPLKQGDSSKARKPERIGKTFAGGEAVIVNTKKLNNLIESTADVCKAVADESVVETKMDASQRYTAAILHVLIEKARARQLQAPALCACNPPPQEGQNEQWVKNMSQRHARNCEFHNNPAKLQRMVLDLVQDV